MRIMVVDDHPIVRDGLTALIERREDMTVVAQAANAAEAIAAFREQRPDVTLMDLRLPDRDGVSAIEAIRQEFPQARMLVVTTFDGDVDIQRALRAGAMGYILKDTPREQLMDAIRTVYNGGFCVPPEVASKLAEHYGIPKLTARELEVLRLIAQGKSNATVGADLTITEGTVKLHVNSILSKLAANDRTHAVIIALRRGLLHLE